MNAPGLSTIRPWIERYHLPAILAGAFLIRLLNIGNRGLQYDDVFSIFLAQRSLTEIVQGTAADTMPPLYYFLLHFWMGLGQSVELIRLLSVLLSVLAVFVAYHLAVRLTNARAAAWTALVMAISPFQFYHAQDVRNYALMLCAQLGYLLFFARLLTPRQNQVRWQGWDWLGLVLSGAAAMYTHNAAVFLIVIPTIYLILCRQWRMMGHLILAQLTIAILALPWLLLVPGQVAKVQFAWWQDPPGLVELLQIPVVWAAGLPLPGIWLAIGLLVSLEILGLIVFECVRQRKDAAELRLLLVLVVFLPAMMFLTSYLVRPIFVPRGFLAAGVGYLVIGGWVIERGWSRGSGKLLLGGFLLAAAIGLPVQASFNGFPRSPFQQAALAVMEQSTPDEVVVHDNKLSYFPFRFYAPELSQVFVADPEGSGNDTFARGSQEAMQLFPMESIEAAVDGAQQVKFVVFTRAIDEYVQLGESGHPSLRWLEEHFHLVGWEVYNDLEVYQFAAP